MRRSLWLIAVCLCTLSIARPAWSLKGASAVTEQQSYARANASPRLSLSSGYLGSSASLSGKLAAGAGVLLPQLTLQSAVEPGESLYRTAVGRVTDLGLAVGAEGVLSASVDAIDVPYAMGSVRADLGPVALTLQEGWQPPVNWTSNYWRPESGMASTQGTFHVPGLLTVFNTNRLVALLPARFDYASRFAPAPESWAARRGTLTGGDVHVDVALATYAALDGDWKARVLAFEWSEWTAADAPVRTDALVPNRNDDHRLYLHVRAFRFELMNITVPESMYGRQYLFELAGGLDDVCPAYGFSPEDGETKIPMRCNVGVRATIGFRTPHYELGTDTLFGVHSSVVGHGIRIRTLSRVTPDGMTAERGFLGEAFGTLEPIEDVLVTGRALVSWLSPRSHSAILDGTPADKDAYRPMGRVDLGADWRFHPRVSLGLGGWAEFSDRYDPTVAGSGTSTPAFSASATAHLRANF